MTPEMKKKWRKIVNDNPKLKERLRTDPEFRAEFTRRIHAKSAEPSEPAEPAPKPVTARSVDYSDLSERQKLGVQLGNIPSSGAAAMSDFVSAIASPIDTVSEIGKTVLGGVQLGLEAVSPYSVDPDAPGDFRQNARDLGAFYAGRYGSMDDFERTTIDDPVGAVMDLTGVGALIRSPLKAPKKRTMKDREFIDEAPNTQQLRSEASNIYKALDKSGVKIPVDDVSALMDDIGDMFQKETMNRHLHPTLHGIYTDIKGDLDTLKGGGGTMPWSNIHTMRKVLKKASRGVNPDHADQRRLAGMAVEKIDDFIENNIPDVAPGFKNARNTWRKMRNSELIEETIDRASTRASGLESGLRNEFATLYRNKKKMRTFTQEERAAIRKISDGDFSANLFRKLGNFHFGLGKQRTGINAMAGTGAGGAGGILMGADPMTSLAMAAAVPALSAGAAKLAEAKTARNAAKARAIAATGKNPDQIPSRKKSARDDLPRPTTAAWLAELLQIDDDKQVIPVPPISFP